MRKKNILIVDEGTAFGGSLIVAARLASALDKKHYNPIIVTAVDINIARDHVHHDIPLYKLSKKIYLYRQSKNNSLSSSTKTSHTKKNRNVVTNLI